MIGGQFRSRRLQAPHGLGTRPTSDRLRETLFNVLGPARVQGARFADLFAGSGAVGIEALSRGAAFVLFAEQAAPAVKALRANLAQFGLSPAQAEVIALPVGRALAQAERAASAFDIVFLDPPYEAAEAYTATLNNLAEGARSLLAPGAAIIAEHARRTPLPARFGALGRTRLLEQGDAALSFYALESTA